MPVNFIQLLFGTALLLLTCITAAASPAQYMAFQKLALYKYDAENKYYLALHSIDDSTDIKNIDLDNLHIRLKKKDGGEIDIDRKDLIILPLGDMYSKWDAQYTYFQFNLVIDTSGSIEDSDLQTVENIVSRFVDRIPSPFKGQVIKFSSAVTKSSFTKDKQQLQNWIRAPHERGQTALHDALGAAVEELKHVGQDVPIKFSVVFTDGQDTASHRYRDEASFRKHIIGQTSNYTIPLFIVGVGDVNVNLLQSISQFGHFKHVQNVPDIDQLFDFVEELIKGTYIFKIPAISSLNELETIFIVEKLSSGKFKTIQDVPVH